MGWQIQFSCILAAMVYCIAVTIEAREIPTGSGLKPLRGAQAAAAAVAAAAAHGVDADDDESLRAGAKRELGEIEYHHGGGGGGHGHGHGHATSYQNFVLHSYHPKKVIYHKKHGHGHHHDSPQPGVPVHAIPHHIPVPIAAAAVPAYDEGIADDGSYSAY